MSSSQSSWRTSIEREAGTGRGCSARRGCGFRCALAGLGAGRRCAAVAGKRLAKQNALDVSRSLGSIGRQPDGGRRDRLHQIWRDDDDEFGFLTAEAAGTEQRADDRQIAEPRRLVGGVVADVFQQAADAEALSGTKDRKSVEKGKSGEVRFDLGGPRINKKKTTSKRI